MKTAVGAEDVAALTALCDKRDDLLFDLLIGRCVKKRTGAVVKASPNGAAEAPFSLCYVHNIYIYLDQLMTGAL